MFWRPITLKKHDLEKTDPDKYNDDVQERKRTKIPISTLNLKIQTCFSVRTIFCAAKWTFFQKLIRILFCSPPLFATIIWQLLYFTIKMFRDPKCLNFQGEGRENCMIHKHHQALNQKGRTDYFKFPFRARCMTCVRKWTWRMS